MLGYSSGSNYTFTTESFKVYSGINNISLRTGETITPFAPEGVGTFIETTELYRKYTSNEELNGTDFIIFKNWIDNK